MIPGSLGIPRCLFAVVCLAAPLRASESVIAYGLTNTAIGAAEIYADPYYGTYSVNSLGSNGLDGVSVFLGEPDSGVFFSPYSGYLQDGNFMIAKPYGRLNGSDSEVLLATVQGGRASEWVYPLTLDYSPLAPQSVTYEIYSSGTLLREFTQGTALVVVNVSYTYPTVNPLFRRTDGALGTDIKLTQPVNFTFPDVLASAYGDELFIRLNNPTNTPGPVARVDVTAGGGLYNFNFNDLALGVFGRPHQSILNATLQARPNWLRIGNLVNTNDSPGVLIRSERLGGLDLQVEPFQLASNTFVMVTTIGSYVGDNQTALGTLRLDRDADRVTIGFEQGFVNDMQVVVLTNGSIVQTSILSAAASVTVPASAAIGSIATHARTIENLPGFHVRFAEPVPVAIPGSGTAVADELRLVLPFPARMEHLHTLLLTARNVDSITITNEAATPPSEPAPLEIFRLPENLHMTNYLGIRWPDPNRLMELSYSEYGLGGPYFPDTNPVTFSDPYRSVTVPIVRTNRSVFYRLYFQPD